LSYLACAYPGKQIERLSIGSDLTGHSLIRNISVITNMTVREGYLQLSMR